MNFKEGNIICTKCHSDKYTVLYSDGALKTWSLISGKQLFNNKSNLEWLSDYYVIK